jgi:uncharacterized OB-fold protein
MSDPDRTPDAASGEADEPFWRALARGVVELPCCSTCGRWVWPVRPICPDCHTRTLVWTEVNPEGRVYSWSRIQYPFVPERSQLPYVVAVVEVPSAGNARVIGVIHGDDTRVRIGTKVSGTIAPPDATTLGLPSLQWEVTD